jgi:uncharacterized membrane protein HdeD (DUF308 family)
LFTTKNVPGFVWTLLGAALAILIAAFLVRRPVAGVLTLTLALAAYFAVHVIIIASWPGSVAWALGLLVGINLFMSALALVMTAIACRSVNDVSEVAASAH